MTDLAKQKVRSDLPRRGRVVPAWDPLVRLVHWGVAAVVLANFALTKEGGSVHIALGWAFWGCG